MKIQKTWVFLSVMLLAVGVSFRNVAGRHTSCGQS